MRMLARPLRYRLKRYRTFIGFERTQWGGAVYRTGSAIHEAGEAAARKYIDATFQDRPDLKQAVTPNYVFSGKRRVVSDDFYPALLRENVELSPPGSTTSPAPASSTPTGSNERLTCW
ncbi:hypothetical protein [Aeromicrobium sp. UC242_57]|uniref:hypothetical protein n=1 Tax=Aeromicrobium sp. UC242_57 TaxID=3374624 RepID=UPI0037AFA75B